MSKLLPHEGVFVRLGCSTIHGVGVFAEQEIPAGTNVFANDHSEVHWVHASDVGAAPLSQFRQALYRDFAIRRGDELGCPANFNLLTVGWYVNEPVPGDEPNLIVTKEFDMIAARNIVVGEELTIVYSTFSRAVEG